MPERVGFIERRKNESDSAWKKRLSALLSTDDEDEDDNPTIPDETEKPTTSISVESGRTSDNESGTGDDESETPEGKTLKTPAATDDKGPNPETVPEPKIPRKRGVLGKKS